MIRFRGAEAVSESVSVWFAVAVAVFVPSRAFAYPTFIRLGYVSCTSCHVSPQGSGQLNDYGKGIGASESLFPTEYKTPGFMEPLSFGGRVNNDLVARGITYAATGGGDTFLMQFDYQNSTQITDTLRVDATIGLMPSNELGSSSTNQDGVFGPDLILRKAMLAYRPQDGLEISGGRDYLPAGLNIDDHTTFLRSQNRFDEFDYATQLRLDTWSENWLFSPFLYGPSYEEDADNREYGGGVRLERAVTSTKTVGLIAQYGSSPSIDRLLLGPFARIGFTENSGILLEYLYDHRSVEPEALGFPQSVVYARPFYLPLEWMEIGFLGEYYKVGDPFADTAWDYGPDVYVRIVRNLTLLFDARFITRDSTTDNVISAQFLAQL